MQDLWSQMHELEMDLMETSRGSEIPPPSTREEAGLCIQCREMEHFCRDCPLDARQKSEGSVSGDWENPCLTVVPVQQRDIAEDQSSGTKPLARASILEWYAC